MFFHCNVEFFQRRVCYGGLRHCNERFAKVRFALSFNVGFSIARFVRRAKLSIVKSGPYLSSIEMKVL